MAAINPMDKDNIVYCAMDSGVDGRAIPYCIYASLSENALDQRLFLDPNRAYITKTKMIVNLAEVRRDALTKLNGIEKLALETYLHWVVQTRQ
jgi:hypothetical protein